MAKRPQASTPRCRICHRPGREVPLPDGFRMPPDGLQVLVLCQWHRGADTRRARQQERLAAELQVALDRCVKIAEDFERDVLGMSGEPGRGA
jgi:hypothetical protein